MTKTTDCLCRKILKEIATYLPHVLVGWALIAVGFSLRMKTEHHPVVSLSFYDKDDVLIFSDEIQTKELPIMDRTYWTDIWPKNYFNALVGVNPKDIKHAERVVVRLK